MTKILPSFRTMPYLIIKDDLVLQSGSAFVKLTGYSQCSFLHKSITDVFQLLRINSSVPDIERNQREKDIYLFTKALEPIEVAISISPLENSNDKLYVFTEKPNSKLADKLVFVDYLFTSSRIGCVIYSVPDLVILKTNNKLLEFMNPSFNTKNKIVGKCLKDVMPGFEGSLSDKFFSDIITTKEPISEYEMRYDNFERGTTYWDGTYTPILIDNNIKYIFQTAIDVTQRVLDKEKITNQSLELELQKGKLQINISKRKRMLEKLKNIHNFNVEILESIHDGFFSLDKEWRFTYINQKAASTFGYKQTDLLNKNIWHTFPHIKGSIIDISLHTIILKKEPVQFEVAGIKTNGYYFFSAYPSSEGVSVYFIDMTERKKFEEELKFQENQLEAVIETMNDAAVILDCNGKMIFINAEARKLYPHFNEQTTVSEVHAGAQYFDLDNHRISIENLPTCRVFKGETIRNERLLIKFPSWEKVMEINATPIFNRENKLVSVFVRHHDITNLVNDQKQLDKQQKKLLQVEKEKNDLLQREIVMKDEFFSLMSHEFRTPISVINAAVQAIELSCKEELSEKATTYIDMIKQNSNRQLKLVNNILDITRMNASHISIEKKDWDIVYLTKSITKSISVIAEQKGIRLSFSSKLKEKIIGIDEEKYERILLNLLSNAVKFTPKGKSIKVRVFKNSDGQKNTVCIQVEDHGIGIPLDKQNLIFERFGQVNTSISRYAEGSGIGLSLVKMLVELMNGEITLKSEESIGSAFTVILPDEKLNPASTAQIVNQIPENHLNRAIAIEFSDVYL